VPPINNVTCVLAIMQLEALVRESDRPEFGLEVLNRLAEYISHYEPSLAGLSAGELDEPVYWDDGEYINVKINRVLANYDLARKGPNCTAPPKQVVPNAASRELFALLEE